MRVTLNPCSILIPESIQLILTMKDVLFQQDVPRLDWVCQPTESGEAAKGVCVFVCVCARVRVFYVCVRCACTSAMQAQSSLCPCCDVLVIPVRLQFPTTPGFEASVSCCSSCASGPSAAAPGLSIPRSPRLRPGGLLAASIPGCSARTASRPAQVVTAGRPGFVSSRAEARLSGWS